MGGPPGGEHPWGPGSAPLLQAEWVKAERSRGGWLERVTPLRQLERDSPGVAGTPPATSNGSPALRPWCMARLLSSTGNLTSLFPALKTSRPLQLREVKSLLAKSQVAAEGRGPDLNPEVGAHVAGSRDPVLPVCCYCVPWLPFLKGAWVNANPPPASTNRLARPAGVNREVQ